MWREADSGVLAPPQVNTVPVTFLAAADSPRLQGESDAHVRALAEAARTRQLPPILVHRATGRIIDGMHRMRAALLNGEREMEVIYHDGPEDEAFVLSVRANVTHGLPLSIADRKAAADRIIAAHPDWSDRAIARIVGLSPKTVAARRRAHEEIPQSAIRVGVDGRRRPLDSTRVRLVVAELIKQHPNASLREIARSAGVSPTTVRNVRQELAREEAVKAAGNGSPLAGGERSARSLMNSIAHDPALRYTDSGRILIQWLMRRGIDLADCDKLADGVPSHCAETVAQLARAYARAWEHLAGKVIRLHTLQ